MSLETYFHCDIMIKRGSTIDEKTKGSIISTMCSNHNFNPTDASIFLQVIKFNNNTIPSDYNECLQRMQDYKNQQRISRNNQNIPKCPTCGSTRVEKISLGKKVVGGAMFGLFSSNVRKTMHCKNCGHKW